MDMQTLFLKLKKESGIPKTPRFHLILSSLLDSKIDTLAFSCPQDRHGEQSQANLNTKRMEQDYAKGKNRLPF
jgi:hypothetical protein